MALEPVFDVSGIDRARSVLSREQIERWIPHRGIMLLLDRVVWLDATKDHGVAAMRARPDAFWTAGHIPGNPLMPGVLMIEAGAQLASILYYMRCKSTCFAGFTRIEDTSFRGQVKPGDELLLLCKVMKYSDKRFVTHIQGLVEHEVVFDSLITGMIFPRMGDVRSNEGAVDPTLAVEAGR